MLTSKQQIDRLLRPGASYFNLNPFEVSRIFNYAAGKWLDAVYAALSKQSAVTSGT